MKPIKTISSETKDQLKRYSWPGNIRALRHAIERAVILSGSEQFAAEDFQLGAKETVPAASQGHSPQTTASDMSELNLDKIEKSTITTALKKCRYNISHTAKALGLTRAALYRRMEKHGL